MDRILVAVRNPLLRQITAHLLAEECDAVDTASSIGELERLSLSGSYRIVITSFAEALCNGSDLARRLHRRSSPTKIFLLTRLRTEEHILALLESGPDQIISIPVDSQRLKRKVRDELKHKV